MGNITESSVYIQNYLLIKNLCKAKIEIGVQNICTQISVLRSVADDQEISCKLQALIGNSAVHSFIRKI